MRFSTEEKIAECTREIQQRERVYRRLIEQKKMTQQMADRQLDIMKEIASDYFRKQAEETRGPPLLAFELG
jgi:hypothetical protein